MNKYIIIDTWNGEGYTDSSAEIIERSNMLEAMQYAKEQAESNDPSSGLEENKEDNYWSYNIGKDNGAYSVVEYKGEYGICIMPDCNEFSLMETKEEYEGCLSKDTNEDFGADMEEVNDMEDGEGVIHNDIGCVIYRKFNECEMSECFKCNHRFTPHKYSDLCPNCLTNQ